MPVGIVAAGAVFIHRLAAGLAQRFDVPAAREGLRIWLPHAGLKAPLGKELATQGWVVLPEMEVLNIGVPLAVRLGIETQPHANAEAALAIVADMWREARPTLTPAAAVALAGDFIALKAQLARAQTPWDDAMTALKAARPTLADDVAWIAEEHAQWLDERVTAVEAAQARLAGLAEQYEAGLKAPVVVAGFTDFTPVGWRVAKAVAGDALGLVVVPETPMGAALMERLGGGEAWDGEEVKVAHPTIMEADDALDEAWGVVMAVREALRSQSGPVAVVAEDTGVATHVRDVLEATGVVVGIEGMVLADTPAGRLAVAVAQAMAGPSAETVTALLQQPLLRAREGWSEAAAALEVGLLRGVGSVAAWGAWQQKWTRVHRVKGKVGALAVAAGPAWEALSGVRGAAAFMSLRGFVEAVVAAMGGLAPAWRTAWGGFEVEAVLARMDGDDDVDIAVLAGVVTFAIGNAQAMLPEEHAGVVIARAADVRLRRWGTVIVAGCNAGCWPARVEHAWFGQKQLAGLGLHDDAHHARVAAEDWAGILRCGGTVIFSRATHGMDGVPLVASALWQEHLATVAPDNRFVVQGRAWRRAGDGAAVAEGALVPVGDVYPRTWSASLIEDMRTCPYRAVARRVLKLEPLPAFEAVPERRELGILFHAWMERLPWVKEDAWSGVESLSAALLRVGEPLLGEFDDAVQKLWQPRLPLLADALAVELLASRAKGWRVDAVEAALPQAAVSAIHVSAKADRVDAQRDARVVIDYKTGQAPGLASMGKGEKPQLPIEAWLMEQAGAHDVQAAVWRLRGFGKRPLEVVPFKSDAWRAAVAAVAPGVGQMTVQFAEGEAWPAWPDLTKGGVLPSGHCAECPLAGVCRFQERSA